MEEEVPDAPTLISNAEVMEILKNRVAAREQSQSRRSSCSSSKRFRHRDWVEGKVLEYLESTPCTRLDMSRQKELKSVLESRKRRAADRNPATSGTASSSEDDDEDDNGLHRLQHKQHPIAGFNLTEAESLQVMNFMPTEPVEIHLMVEDLHDRMSESEQDALLELIASYSTEKEAPLHDEKKFAAEAGANYIVDGVKAKDSVKIKEEDS